MPRGAMLLSSVPRARRGVGRDSARVISCSCAALAGLLEGLAEKGEAVGRTNAAKLQELIEDYENDDGVSEKVMMAKVAELRSSSSAASCRRAKCSFGPMPCTPEASRATW